MLQSMRIKGVLLLNIWLPLQRLFFWQHHDYSQAHVSKHGVRYNMLQPIKINREVLLNVWLPLPRFFLHSLIGGKMSLCTRNNSFINRQISARALQPCPSRTFPKAMDPLWTPEWMLCSNNWITCSSNFKLY